MFCTKCGNKIKEGNCFCEYCGTPAAVIQTAVQQPMEQTPEALPTQKSAGKNKKLFLIGAELLIFALLVAGTIGITIVRKESSEQTTAFQKKKQTSDTTEARTAEGKAEDVETETQPTEEEAAYDLFVCVPADYMSLRTTPGLGDDVIARLNAGSCLKWYGESITVDETEFYKVVVRDSGQEGYVAADYCVEVDYDFDESPLTVVETDMAIYTYDMMVEDIAALCNTYPDRISSRILGSSNDGRNIYEVVLGNPNAQKHIMMQAAIHGREYMTAQLAMKLLEYYSYFYETAQFDGISYKELFDKTAIHIVPMSNPDGVVISQLGVDALHNADFADLVYECYVRDKGTLTYEEDANGYMNWVDHYLENNFNRETIENKREITFAEYQTIWKSNARGVDLNNNFDAAWNGIDLKKAPAYGSFKGNAPVSEPESRLLVDLANEYDFSYFISYHSRGQLIYYDVTGNSPENTIASTDFANFLCSRTKYKPVNTNKGYGVNLGGFGDWVQLSLNKPSVTIENGKMPCPLTEEEFPAIWYRNRETWAMLAKQIYP